MALPRPSTVLLSLLALVGVLAACSAARDPDSAKDDCHAAKADHLIGENVSGYIERQAMRESGAQDVRVLHPDDAATMDFNPRRLNLHTDPDKVIIKVACG